ncbi:hypothetical protein JOD53_002296 [Brevibacterium luteolum]|nr:hypothetical protein [Brevibacterium luteolum]
MIVVEGEESCVGDVVGSPRRRIVQGVDDRLPVEDLAVGEDHDAVAGHDLSVEVRAIALAEGLPSLVLEFEQFAEHDGGLLRFAEFQPTAG